MILNDKGPVKYNRMGENKIFGENALLFLHVRSKLF